MLAEQGLSAHVTDNNDEFLIGAPGIHTWKGSVIRYRQHTTTVDPSLSRRDTTAAESATLPSSVKANARRRTHRQTEETMPISYDSDVPNPEKFEQPNDSYFGYAVGSGYFDSSDRERLLYVATAPQADHQSGEVN